MLLSLCWIPFGGLRMYQHSLFCRYHIPGWCLLFWWRSPILHRWFRWGRWVRRWWEVGRTCLRLNGLGWIVSPTALASPEIEEVFELLVYHPSAIGSVSSGWLSVLLLRIGSKSFRTISEGLPIVSVFLWVNWYTWPAWRFLRMRSSVDLFWLAIVDLIDRFVLDNRLPGSLRSVGSGAVFFFFATQYTT